MTKSIHIYASLGVIGKKAAGGGQVSARRLVKVLDGMGYEVLVVNRTIPPYTSKTLWAKLHKIIGFFIDPIRFFLHLLLRRRKDSVALIIGYSGKLFPYYFLFVRIGKLLGYKTVFYLKGGFTESKFTSISKKLQGVYKKGLMKVDFALYEGEEGANISTRICPKTRAIWIPNFVENGFYPKQFPIKPNDTINLLYFGRIQPSKNVLMVVDVFDLLCASFSNIKLTIVGSGDLEYEMLLSERLKQSQNAKKIIWQSRIEHERLKDILLNHHFFVFPSDEPQEGHSNSLNEAMSFGLVPIVSNFNFLPRIVGNEQLVVQTMKAESFASTIERIIKNDYLESLSREMYERVQLHFTQFAVERKLKEVLNSL